MDDKENVSTTSTSGCSERAVSPKRTEEVTESELTMSFRSLKLTERSPNVSNTRRDNLLKITSKIKAYSNPITEERFQHVLWLYRIRKQFRRMGLFQPDFICIIFGKMMSSKLQRSNDDIKIAVDAWCEDSVKAEAMYGHISKWNTSLVTNMNDLFSLKREFNDDISKWNVGNVTSMSSIFYFATKFNGDISNWNVSNVIYFMFAFEGASIFNGDISRWDVGNATTMDGMFHNTIKFNGDISNWNVSRVTTMNAMFNGTRLFNCDLSKWDVTNVKDMTEMFHTAEAFNSDITTWNVSNVSFMTAMFAFATSFRRNISKWTIADNTEVYLIYHDCNIPEMYKAQGGNAENNHFYSEDEWEEDEDEWDEEDNEWTDED